ncbi:MAG: circadian clock protein KaiC, partial [Candidatus Obscuribacterales bacterium]|nr:circadian clock protein KaiC [Steroidobacteraceae bacterium]
MVKEAVATDYISTGYISTGIHGLDVILSGGFLRNGFYLLQGDPGSGKTTVALQFLLDGHKQGERNVYITLTETSSDLKRVCESHNWSMDAIDVCDLSTTDLTDTAESQYVMFQPSEVELGEVTRKIMAAVERTKPQRMVFDGLSELRLLATEPLRYRRQLLALKQFFEERNITVLVLDDRTSKLGQLDPETIVGGN